MATDVDVQFFSHLNGLTLDNNWGDMIRLLDTCLVNGLPLTNITSASIDAQGDIKLNLYAAHNCMLFQIIELAGFAPSELNGKYRIKGTPTSTQLILKATHIGKTITTAGTAKLASLGYDIIFRDIGGVKRVYRAKNPRTEHPFIRVDESLSGEGGGSYTSTYAKSAMVGLIENMSHIDDYDDPGRLQLPLNTSDFKKNWSITGAGGTVVRGWCKWPWSNFSGAGDTYNEAAPPSSGLRNFTLCGDSDAFYLTTTVLASSTWQKMTYGCGLYDDAIGNSIIPNWFIFSLPRSSAANLSMTWSGSTEGSTPLFNTENSAVFYIPKNTPLNRINNHTKGMPITPDYFSGRTLLYSASNIAALQIPFCDAEKYLRGTLKHICYAGNTNAANITTPLLADNSMYVWDAAYASNKGGVYCYLGELE